MSLPKSFRLSDESLGALVYITFVPAVLFLLFGPRRRNPGLRYHAWQSIAINVVGIALTYIVAFAVVGLSLGAFAYVGLTWLVMFSGALTWSWCAIRAMHGKRARLPLLGTWAESLASAGSTTDRSVATTAVFHKAS